MTTSTATTTTLSKKQQAFERRVADLAAITSYIRARGQVTSADVMNLLGSRPCTVSRQLRILCMTGAIHQITKYSGRAGGHAVYGPGHAPVDADGEEVDERVALRLPTWPDGHAHRDPMVAALFGAPATHNTTDVLCRVVPNLEPA